MSPPVNSRRISFLASGEVKVLAAKLSSTLERLGRVKRCKRNSVIFSQGGRGDSIYLLIEGIVEISFLSSSGAKKILFLVRPGAFLGKDAFLERPHSVTATARTDCRLVEFPVSVFSCSEASEVMLMLISSLAVEATILGYHLLSVTYSRAHQRVMFSLWFLASLSGSGRSKGSRAEDMVGFRTRFPPIRVTQEYLAEIAGVSRQTVGEVISYLKGHSVIECQPGRRVAVKDMAKLETLLREDEIHREALDFVQDSIFLD
ncbi:MAG: Crp/Fnr family transcriptional regulator [Clostridia bacterium]|nr:MAG: Crp/Fnr family transcriptional regulator [Clostridia bacterium]